MTLGCGVDRVGPFKYDLQSEDVTGACAFAFALANLRKLSDIDCTIRILPNWQPVKHTRVDALQMRGVSEGHRCAAKCQYHIRH